MDNTVRLDEWLVGGIPAILKNDGLRQWVSDDIPYMKWRIIQMFKTNNQMVYWVIHMKILTGILKSLYCKWMTIF